MPAKKRSGLSIAEMQKSPGHLVRRLHQFSTAAFLAEVRDYGITSVQFAAMVAIQNKPGIDAVTLCDVISTDRTTIGQVIARLLAKDLLVRGSLPEDRRRKYLKLTDKGEKLADEISQLIPRVEERIVGSLTPDERKTLIALLTRLT